MITPEIRLLVTSLAAQTAKKIVVETRSRDASQALSHALATAQLSETEFEEVLSLFVQETLRLLVAHHHHHHPHSSGIARLVFTIGPPTDQ